MVIKFKRSQKMGPLTPLMFVLLAFAIGCETTTDSESISTNIGKGPGGPATLMGKVTGKSGEVLDSPKLYVLSSSNYDKELAMLLVNSSDGSFMITDLPEEIVDIIALLPDYPVNKMADIALTPGITTVVIECDEVLLYIPNEVVVEFKNANIDSTEAAVILKEYELTVWKRSTHDSLPGRVFYFGIIPEGMTVLEIVKIISFDERILRAKPNYLYTTTVP